MIFVIQLVKKVKVSMIGFEGLVLGIWSMTAMVATLKDELFAKFGASLRYSFCRLQFNQSDGCEYESASTLLYGLQDPPSFPFWLPIHILTATIVTGISCYAIICSVRLKENDEPERIGKTLRRVFYVSHLVFTLTVVMQLGKLTDLPFWVATLINSSLLIILQLAAYKSKSAIHYLLVLSVPLTLTAIATYP